MNTEEFKSKIENILIEARRQGKKSIRATDIQQILATHGIDCSVAAVDEILSEVGTQYGRVLPDFYSKFIGQIQVNQGSVSVWFD